MRTSIAAWLPSARSQRDRKQEPARSVGEWPSAALGRAINVHRFTLFGAVVQPECRPLRGAWGQPQSCTKGRDSKLSEASITALALEESLLREWGEFHTLIEQHRTAPTTRDAAEQFVQYSRNDAFVDSVVDALSLYLADRNEFDAKFGGYLDLMLIQRARAEDLVVLKKLATKYAAAGDIVSMIGLMHRLQMYAGDARLQEIADICASALQQVKGVEDMNAWARSIGVEPLEASWTFSLKLGSAPPNYWMIRKHDLRPRDVSLDLLLNDAHWRVQVARVDRNYSAQWRPSGITVATDETRLKALAAWPKLVSPQLFPLFTGTLAQFLRVEWLRSAWISSTGVSIDKARLLDWLHTAIDEVHP